MFVPAWQKTPGHPFFHGLDFAMHIKTIVARMLAMTNPLRFSGKRISDVIIYTCGSRGNIDICGAITTIHNHARKPQARDDLTAFSFPSTRLTRLFKAVISSSSSAVSGLVTGSSGAGPGGVTTAEGSALIYVFHSSSDPMNKSKSQALGCPVAPNTAGCVK